VSPAVARVLPIVARGGRRRAIARSAISSNPGLPPASQPPPLGPRSPCQLGTRPGSAGPPCPTQNPPAAWNEGRSRPAGHSVSQSVTAFRVLLGARSRALNVCYHVMSWRHHGGGERRCDGRWAGIEWLCLGSCTHSDSIAGTVTMAGRQQVCGCVCVCERERERERARTANTLPRLCSAACCCPPPSAPPPPGAEGTARRHA
jgi:hypothetical protein